MDKPAFPCVDFLRDHPGGERREYFYGLTRRELFAAMAMQGILAKSGRYAEGKESVLAQYAIAHADALIAELDKP